MGAPWPPLGAYGEVLATNWPSAVVMEMVHSSYFGTTTVA